jgi:PleD family two-component response regulator
LRKADQAMYRAKDDGKGRHVILDRNGTFVEDFG